MVSDIWPIKSISALIHERANRNSMKMNKAECWLCNPSVQLTLVFDIYFVYPKDHKEKTLHRNLELNAFLDI